MIRKNKKEVKDAYTDLLLVNGVYPKIDKLSIEDKNLAYDLIKELADCQITYFPDMEDFENEDNKEALTKKFLEIKDYYNQSNYMQSIIEFAILEAFKGTANNLIEAINQLAKGESQNLFEEMSKNDDPNAPRHPWGDAKPKHYIFKFKDGTIVECHSAEPKDAVKKEAINVYKQMKDEEFEAEYEEIEATPVETTEVVTTNPSAEIEGIYDISDSQNVIGMKTDSDDLLYIADGTVIYPNFRQYMETGKIPYQEEVKVAANLANASGRTLNNLDDAIWLTIIVEDLCDKAGVRMSFESNAQKEEVIRRSLGAQRTGVIPQTTRRIGQDSKVKDFFEPIKSFKSWEFKKVDNQGDEVVALYEDGTEHSDDNRLMVICKRPEGKGLEGRPYLIGAGYSPEDGHWNQGYYDFKTFEDAEKFLKENYKVIPFVTDSVNAKDWLVPLIIEVTYEDLQKNYAGLVFPCKDNTWDYEILNGQSVVDDYNNDGKISIIYFAIARSGNGTEEAPYSTILAAMEVVDDENKAVLENRPLGEFSSKEEAIQALKEEYCAETGFEAI